MTGPTVELTWDVPGAEVDGARAALRSALLAAGLPPWWDEWRAGDPLRPRHLRREPAPAVFANGKKIWGGKDGPAEIGSLAARLAESRAWRHRPARREPLARRLRFSLLPAFGLVLLPKCPLCWAAYSGVAASAGLGGLAGPAAAGWSAAALAAALLLAVAGVALRARATAARRPALLAAAGAAAVLAGRFAGAPAALAWVGLGILALAAVDGATGLSASRRPLRGWMRSTAARPRARAAPEWPSRPSPGSPRRAGRT